MQASLRSSQSTVYWACIRCQGLYMYSFSSHRTTPISWMNIMSHSASGWHDWDSYPSVSSYTGHRSWNLCNWSKQTCRYWPPKSNQAYIQALFCFILYWITHVLVPSPLTSHPSLLHLLWSKNITGFRIRVMPTSPQTTVTTCHPKVVNKNIHKNLTGRSSSPNSS